MKKNYYGNIEDIVQNIKMVTSKVFNTYFKLNREHFSSKANGQESQMAPISIILSWVMKETSESSLNAFFVLEKFQKLRNILHLFSKTLKLALNSWKKLQDKE